MNFAVWVVNSIGSVSDIYCVGYTLYNPNHKDTEEENSHNLITKPQKHFLVCTIGLYPIAMINQNGNDTERYKPYILIAPNPRLSRMRLIC